MDLVFDTMDEMIAKTKPEAATAFNTIYDHLSVVEFCAPRGIHVMVEKPLAVNMTHANKMKELAHKHNIQLLTNYETTWYGTHQKAWQYIIEQKLAGDLRKIVFHTGHQGPFEIGCNKEFTDWLTDPVLNGGGALTDFELLWLKPCNLADERAKTAVSYLHYPTNQARQISEGRR